MKKICIIGCGNVGSRHLQAIAKLPYPIDVKIIEPNMSAQELGRKRLEEIEFNKETHRFSWYKTIDHLKERSDLTIVATTSIGRVDLIISLLELGHDRFLVEKMVCQSKKEYEKLLSEINKYKAKGWVNTNPRCFRSYQTLKDYFEGSEIMHFSVTASNISSLGTNTIHYMDLFSYFVNDYNIKINGKLLFDKVFPNKRGEQLVEFAGTVVGSTKIGSTISLTFLPAVKLPTIVNIVGIDKHVMIDETNQKCCDLVNTNNEFDFIYEHASTITTKISNDILEKDSCCLTTLNDSQILHQEIFEMFNSHIKKITNKEPELCPIT